MNTRLLGIMGILGGAALAAVELRHAISGVPLNGATLDSIDHGLYFLWGLGELCAFWAIYALGATGSEKLKTEPPPCSLSTATLPPCASTVCFTIARPSPVPLPERARSTL